VTALTVIVWIVLSLPLALLVGGGIRLADSPSGTQRRCFCGRPIRDPNALYCAEHD
jgi:hypothetical protein